MVLATIHAKVIIFLMGRIDRVRKYLGIIAAASMEVLAFPCWPDSSKLWEKLFAIFLENIDNFVSI